MVSQHFDKFFIQRILLFFFIFLNKFISMHHRNFQTLATEMFKTQIPFSAKIVRKYLFPKQVTVIFIETIFFKGF